jgi:hypothetical protein
MCLEYGTVRSVAQPFFARVADCACSAAFRTSSSDSVWLALICSCSGCDCRQVHKGGTLGALAACVIGSHVFVWSLCILQRRFVKP